MNVHVKVEVEACPRTAGLKLLQSKSHRLRGVIKWAGFKHVYLPRQHSKMTTEKLDFGFPSKAIMMMIVLMNKRLVTITLRYSGQLLASQ